MIPKPLPFIRIGLANLPLMAALDIFPRNLFILLVLLKILGQALITGTLFSYVFLLSLAGTCSSAVVMYLLARSLGRNRISFIGIGVTGALVSNASQLFLARFFILGEGVQFLLPPFLISGLVTGIALGVFCEVFTARSRWYHHAMTGDGKGGPGLDGSDRDFTGQTADLSQGTARRGKRYRELFSSRDLCIAGLFLMAAFLLNPSTPVRCLQFLLFWFFAFLGGKKNNPLFTGLVILGIVFFNLLIPYGKVLAEIGPFRLTQGSLLSGIRKAVTLEGLIMLSRVAVRPDLRLPGFFGALLGESFRIFEKITRRRGLVTRKNFMEGLDRLLVSLSAETEAEDQAETPPLKPEQRKAGLLLLAAAVLLTAGLTTAGLILEFSLKQPA
jgi:heptaprenyl diphosphate synthase